MVFSWPFWSAYRYYLNRHAAMFHQYLCLIKSIQSNSHLEQMLNMVK